MNITRILPVIPEDMPTHDNSSLALYAKCPRLYELKVLQKKEAIGTRPALDFGSFVHLGLETWYKTRDPAHTLDVMRETEFSDPLEDYRTKQRAMLVVADYIAHYENDPHWKIIMTETPFDLEDENGFRWGGRIDLVVEWLGRLWIVDHKTTSRGGASYYDSFFPDPATVGYAWAASLLHGKPVSGVIINRILVHKKHKKAEELFERRPFNYLPWHFEEWYEAQIDKYLAIHADQTRGYFRPHWENCVTKYGRCEMFEVCRTAPQNRERFLEQEFKEATWDWRED